MFSVGGSTNFCLLVPETSFGWETLNSVEFFQTIELFKCFSIEYSIRFQFLKLKLLVTDGKGGQSTRIENFS